MFERNGWLGTGQVERGDEAAKAEVATHHAATALQ